jgi:hypothetical protein
LSLCLLKRASVHDEAEHGSILRFLILPNIILQSVGELFDRDIRIERQSGL